MKYFKGNDGWKLKVDGNQGFLKSPSGKETEIPSTSKKGTDIILENNPISKAEYDK